MIPHLLLVALGLGGPADDPKPPARTMTVKMTDDFDVTGDGSAAAWKKAEWQPLHPREDAKHPYTTRVKALYSKTGFYALFEATDKTLTATKTADFDNLWEEDVVEVFLWTDETHPVYFEYEVSPLGVELPIIVPNLDGRIMGWRPWHYAGGRKVKKMTAATGGPVKSGAAVTGWSAEVFIPYELLAPLGNVPPKPGTKWRGNFYRFDHDGGKEKPASWDWSRVGESFHEFKKFGTLVFE